MTSVNSEFVSTALALAREGQSDPQALSELIELLESAKSESVEINRADFRLQFLSLLDIEKAEFLYRQSLRATELSDLTGISTRRVYQLVRLARLPEPARGLLKKAQLTERQVRPFLSSSQRRLMEALEVISGHQLRPVQSERLAKLGKQNPDTPLTTLVQSLA